MQWRVNQALCYELQCTFARGNELLSPDHFIWKGNVTKQNVPSIHLGMGEGVGALRTVI